MNLIKVGEIEVYSSNELSKNLTRKQKEELINKLFKEKYQGKEISYFLNKNEIKAVINKFTRKNFLISKHGGKENETMSELKAKENIVISNGLDPLIYNFNFKARRKDNKTIKTEKHNENVNWLYFIKQIIFDNILYNVIIDIRENNGKYFIYHIKIKRG